MSRSFKRKQGVQNGRAVEDCLRLITVTRADVAVAIVSRVMSFLNSSNRQADGSFAAISRTKRQFDRFGEVRYSAGVKMPTRAAIIISLVLFLAARGNAVAQVLFFDDFEQFGNGTDLTSTNYVPASGLSSASVVTSVQDGSPTIKATNFLGDTWALFDNSVVTNKNSYEGLLSSIQTNQPLQITWKMWIQATNSGPGMYLLSLPVQDANPSVTYNPTVVFMDAGSIVALTNGTSVQIPVGNWGSLAGTVMSNTLILDYPNASFSYSLNGQLLATLPLGPYFTNVIGAIYFTGFERSAGSLGNRFAIDDVKVELAGFAHPPSFQWAKLIASTTNTDDELSIGLATDSAANLYVTGWFDGTNDFGGIILTNSSGGGQDIFVAKYNSSGTLQWAQRAGSDTPPGTATHDEGRDAGRGIGVDSAGSVYVTGGFFGHADFGSFNLAALMNKEFFLAKYDNSGRVQWVRQSAGGNGMSGSGWSDGVYGTGLAVDGAGNCYAVGFAANVTASGAPVTFGTTSLFNTNTDGGSTFLVKYDNTGTAQWAKSFNSPDQSYGTKVTLDASGNVYVKGGFSTSMRIGTTNLVSISQRDMFIAKFDSSGALIWVRQEEASGGEGGVAVDQVGNVYVTGAFSSNPINLSGTSLTNAGSFDAFVAKYSSSGAPRWARRAGGPNFDFYWDVALDQQGNIHVGGVLSSSAVAPSGSGAAIAKYDASGTYQWANSASGPSTNPVSSVVTKCAVDSAGNCYLVGWYQTATTFGTNVLQPQGYWNVFLAKLGFAPFALGIEWSGSRPRLSVSGDIGTRFALEYVPALAASNHWQSLVTNTLTSNPFIFPDTSAAGSSARFYRARLVP